MNDLIRPTLYQAWMDIVPLVEQSGRETKTYDVVGPVCESGDWLGKERSLAIASDDLLAVRTAGAYGFTMASNYNSRPRAAEQIGRAHVLTPVTNAHLVCRLLRAKNNHHTTTK